MTTLPKTLPPPPRRVRLLATNHNPLWINRLILIPLALVGIAAALYGLFLLLASLCAVQLPATALAPYTQTSGNSTSYFLPFTYLHDGRVYPGQDTIDKTTYTHFLDLATANQPPQPTAITIYYYRQGSLVHASIYPAWTPLLFAAAFTLVWNFCVALFLRQNWLLPLRRRWLCQHGLPTPGTILSKITGRKLNYLIYSYQSLTGKPYQKKMLVPRIEDWQSTTPHQSLTVLHHPTKPHLSTLYELSGYEILPDSPHPYTTA